MSPLAFLAFVFGISTISPKQAPPPQDERPQTQEQVQASKDDPRTGGQTRASGSGDKN